VLQNNNLIRCDQAVPYGDITITQTEVFLTPDPALGIRPFGAPSPAPAKTPAKSKSKKGSKSK
jgi:hypothetical protein